MQKWFAKSKTVAARGRYFCNFMVASSKVASILLLINWLFLLTQEKERMKACQNVDSEVLELICEWFSIFSTYIFTCISNLQLFNIILLPVYLCIHIVCCYHLLALNF